MCSSVIKLIDNKGETRSLKHVLLLVNIFAAYQKPEVFQHYTIFSELSKGALPFQRLRVTATRVRHREFEKWSMKIE